MELKRYKLGELLDVNRGMSLSGEHYSETGDLVRLTLGNFDLTNNGFKENTSKTDIYFAGPVKPEYILKKGDIITPLTEQTPGLLGCTARIPESGKYIQSQDVALVKCKESLLDPSFCYYLIQSESVRRQLGAAAQQTKIRHTSPEKIKAVIVDIPEIEEQRKIGSLLDSLSAKIELNKSINANLEAMAKQLYDYWFVQFDFPDENGRPYKSSGGKMVWNEKLKREIPEGWEDLPVSRCIAPIERGISYTSADIESGQGMPMINLACFSKQGNYRTGEMKYFSGEVKQQNIARPFDVFIACTDMTQGADIIGRPIFATKEYGEYVFSTDLAKLTPTGVHKMYLYHTLRKDSYHKYIKPYASGTTVKHLALIGVEKYPILIPPTNLQDKFELVVRNIMEMVMLNINNTFELAKQRDELLPLLMNGQVSITE